MASIAFFLHLLLSLFSSSWSFRNPCHCGEKPQILLMGLFKITFTDSCFDFCTLFWQMIIVFGWGQSFFLSSKIKTQAQAALKAITSRTTLSCWLHTIVWTHSNDLGVGHRHFAFLTDRHCLSVLICQRFGDKYENSFIHVFSGWSAESAANLTSWKRQTSMELVELKMGANMYGAPSGSQALW